MKRTAITIALALIMAFACACTQVAQDESAPTASAPAAQTSPEPTQASPVQERVPEPWEQDHSAFNGNWVNEQSGFILAVKGGQYRLSKPDELFIMAGDCTLGEGDRLLCGEYVAARSGGVITIEGIDGEFAYTIVYDGGASDDYLGEWENDTTDHRLTISPDECTFSSMSGSFHVTGYAAEPEGLHIGTDDEPALIELTPDGGLTAGGYEGTFYRVGLGMGAKSPYAEFLGSWENGGAGYSLSIQEGLFALSNADMSFSMGGCSRNEDGTLSLGDSHTAALNEDGTLSLSGVDGAFDKVGEYVAPEPSATPAPAATPAPRRHESMRYGLTEATQNGLVFLEPQTGTRITLNGILTEGLIVDESHNGGEIVYNMVASPDPKEEFSLFSSEITAMCSIVLKKANAGSSEDVVKSLADPDFDAFRIIEQTKNHALILEYDTYSEPQRHIYRWGYLFDDGSVLNVSLTLNEADSGQMSAVSIEPGVLAAQGDAKPAQGGPVEADESGEAAGLGLVVGAWYSEEAEAAIIFNPDGTAKINIIDESLPVIYYLHYEEGFNNIPYVTIENDTEIMKFMISSSILMLDDGSYIFYRTSVEELPEYLR